MKNLIMMLLVVFSATVAFAQPSLKEGLRHLENENYQAALEQFNAIAKMDPKNGTIYYYIGEVSYRQDNKTDAEKAYRKGLTINSSCAECKVGLGKLMLDQKKEMEATELFESAARLDKKNPEIFSMIGSAYLHGVNPNAQKAIEYLTTARDMDTKKARYWAQLGDAYKLAGNNGEAVTNYERAIELDPTITSAYVSLARIWMAAKAYDSAESNLKRAIERAPNDAPAYKDLVELYIQTNNYAKVTPLLAKYNTLIGDDIESRVRYVKFLTFQAKDYDRAIEEGEKLLKTNPEQYTLHRWLAWAYGEKEMHKEAYQQSKALFEDIGKSSERKAYASDYDYWARGALGLGLIDTAAHIYRKYIEFEPDRAAEIYGTLAKAYYDTKNYEQAIAYYLRKAEIKELTNIDNYYLGYAYYIQRQDDQADSLFAVVLEVNPTIAPLWLNRAKIAYGRDQVDSTGVAVYTAKPMYENYILHAKEDVEKNKKGLLEAYKYMGIYYVQVDSLDLAMENFQQVLAIDSTDQEIIDNLKILKEQR